MWSWVVNLLDYIKKNIIFLLSLLSLIASSLISVEFFVLFFILVYALTPALSGHAI